MLLQKSFFLLCFFILSIGAVHLIPRTPTPIPQIPTDSSPTLTQSIPSTTFQLSSLQDRQAQGTYLTNCDWCYGHFSLCHQPTGAPDAVIYSQCYCNTFFQAVYQGCVTDCGWSIAGIPPLAEITQTCDSWSVNGLGAVTGAANGGSGGGGGNAGGGEVSTTVVKPAPKGTAYNGGGPNGSGIGNGGSNGGGSGSGNGNGGSGNRNGSDSSATSGADERKEEHGLLLRVESVVFAGLAVLWIFGWL